jgi:hypothetical protein
MTKTTSKPAAVARGKQSKPASPKKARQVPNMKEKFKNMKGQSEPTIRVVGFEDPLAFEIYDYTLTATRPGFVNEYRKWSKGEKEANSLTEANFTGFKIQRDNEVDGNESLKDDLGYSRIWIIRFPHEKETKINTRADGL